MEFIIYLVFFLLIGTAVLSVVWLIQEGWAWLERSDSERGLTYRQWRRGRHG